MRRINKNKRGFTLIEMMLSLAIIAIIFGLTTALMVSISNSFTMTYNLNDASDYAMLYGYGIENSVLARVNQNKSSTWKIATCTPTGGTEQKSVLMYGDGDDDYVFLPHQMKTTEKNTNNVVDKWIISMYFKVDGSLVKYVVLVQDNYCNPTKPVLCKYEGSFWIPHSSVTLTTSGSTNSLAPGYYSELNYTAS